MFIYTIGDILSVIFGFIMLSIFVVIVVGDWWRRRNCLHTAYRENSQCHGICCKCGKDLGFIGDLRKDKTKQEIR
jgi:hypothetical protein